MYNSDVETLIPAAPGATNAKISYGLDFPAACSKHIEKTFQASRVFIIASGSLVRNTACLERLETAIGTKNIAGKFVGMKPHTLWSEVLEIVELASDTGADCLVTLGAGSLTDGAKIVAFVSAIGRRCITITYSELGFSKQSVYLFRSGGFAVRRSCLARRLCEACLGPDHLYTYIPFCRRVYFSSWRHGSSNPSEKSFLASLPNAFSRYTRFCFDNHNT